MNFNGGSNMNVLNKVFAILLFTWANLTFADVSPVKLSKSGICHDKSSPWYHKTKDFKAYASIENCLAAGGRLPSKHKPKDANVGQSSGYDRSLFPHWLDQDGDCQDTRAEILIARSLIPVKFSDRGQCYVTSGKWYDSYTDQYWFNDDDVHIDHVVTLKWAFDHGADKWSRSKRTMLANDPENLLVVEDNVNMSKGARGPSEWLPPNHVYRCDYIKLFVTLARKYGLEFTISERRIVERQLGRCNS